MTAIDGHIHIEHWADGREGDMTTLWVLWRITAGVRTYMGQCGLHSCFERKRRIAKYNGRTVEVENPRYFAHGGLVYPQLPVQLPVPKDFAFVRQVEELMEIGFDGIKMLEGKPNVRCLLGVSLADPAYDEYFSLLEEGQIHLLWHVNDPCKLLGSLYVISVCSGQRLVLRRRGISQLRRGYEEIYTILQRHPLLKVTFAHLFFLSEQPDRLVQLFETYPNVCVDITPGSEMYRNMSIERKLWRHIFTRYADRFLLGTDTYSLTPLEMAKDRLENIFSSC